MIEYEAYHGTNAINVASIKSNGFKPSESRDEWLGFGVYFFIEGAFCPIDNARDWAKAQAWDNTNKLYSYHSYSILRVSVSGNRVLDLRIEDDLKIFDAMREHIFKRYIAEKSNFKTKITPDTFLCDSVVKSMKIDILISNFYIKNTYQRKNLLNSRIPNSTVLCAKGNSIIDDANIEEVEVGVVDNE